MDSDDRQQVSAITIRRNVGSGERVRLARDDRTLMP
jgi:hypothetical protein